MAKQKLTNWKERIYLKYGRGIDRKLFESLRAHDVFDLDQAGFRARNDNGSEAAATWIAALNTNWTQDTDINFRVRFLVQEVGAGTLGGILQNAGQQSGSLQFRINGGAWTVVTAGTAVRFSNSGNFTNGDSTTQQLGSGTFVAGKMLEADPLQTTTLNGDDETEWEWSLQLRAILLSDGDTVELRVVGEDGATAVFASYTQIPSITVNIPVPTDLSDVDFASNPSYSPPFETSSKKYGVTIAKQTGRRGLAVMGATQADPTPSQWTLQDTMTLVPGQILSVNVAMEGSNLHIVTGESGGRYAYHLFNTSTDTWTTENQLISSPGTHAIYDSAPSLIYAGIQQRTTGPDTLVFASVVNAGENRVALFERNGGTWSAIDDAANNIDPGGIVVGNESIFSTGIGYMRGDGALKRFFHSDGASTLSINSNADTTTDTADYIFIPGGKDTLNEAAYIDSDNTVSLINNVSTITTGLSQNTIYGHGRTAPPYAAGCLARIGSDEHLLYVDDATQNLRHSQNTGGGWGTDTEILTGTLTRIAAREAFAGDSILYFYEDAGVLTFGRFTGGGATEQTITTNFNSLLEKQGILASANLNALLEAQGIERTADLNALLQNTETKTALLNAVLQRLDVTAAADLNAAIQEAALTKTTDLNAVLANSVSKTLDLNAVLKAIGVTVAADLNAVLQGVGVTQTVDLNALLQKLDQVQTADLNAAIAQVALTVTADLNAVLQAMDVPVSANLNAILLGTVTQSLNLNAIIKNVQTINADLNAILQGTVTKGPDLNAAIQEANLTLVSDLNAVIQAAGVTAAANLNAIIQKVGETRSADLNAILKRLDIDQTVALNAILQGVGSASIVTDLNAVLQRLDVTQAADFNALIQAVGLTQTADLNALLQALDVTTVADLNAAIQADGLTSSADLNAVLQILDQAQTADLNALLQVLDVTASADLNAILLKVGEVRTVALNAVLTTIGEVLISTNLNALVQAVDLTSSADLNAILQARGLTAGANLNAILQALDVTTAADLNAAIQKPNLVTTVDLGAAIQEAALSRTVDFDAILQAAAANKPVNLNALLQGVGVFQSVSLDAILRDFSFEIHPERTLIVEREDRRLVVENENRVLGVTQ